MDELRKRQKIISQLVEARLEQGISQAELARRLGIQRSGINRLESGTQNPTLDMILKIASALGKDVSLELNDKEEPMSNVYSLRIYDTELMRFSMEKQGLSGLVAEILYTNEEQAHLLPLDMERTGEGVIHWLERRVIPKNRAFVDEILKTLGLSHNDTKGIIDVCKGCRSTTAIGWCRKDLRGDSPNTIFTKIAFPRYWRWWPIPAQAGAGRRLPHPRS